MVGASRPAESRRCGLRVALLAAISLPALAAASGTPMALDVKVSKAMRDRGYDFVRISVVDDGTKDYGSLFSYNSPFVHKWTKLHLHSSIVQVPNGSATFDIGGQKVTVRLPKEGGASRGFFIADPCFSSRDMFCPFQDSFKIKSRLVQIINTLVGSEEIDFWGIIGDNFYEFRDPIGAQLFAELSAEAKATPFLAVPGNHDFWINGGPGHLSTDQFGNGFMQYYGQDTEAALKGPAPYDFSVDPSAFQIAAYDNFAFSHQIGDIAFFGFSGAHKIQELRPSVSKFCSWMENAPTVNTAVILGHWNEENLGCTTGMSAPDVYRQMKEMPGCQNKTLLYVDGHDHCNLVSDKDHGFMIGANGMGGCGQFGFMIMESDPNAYLGANVRVDYFELAYMNTTNRSHPVVEDYFDDIFSCLSQQGYTGCRDVHATQWRAVPQRPTTQAPATTTAAPTPSPIAPSGDGGSPPWAAILGTLGAVLVAGGAGAAAFWAHKRARVARAERVELEQQLRAST